MWTEFGIWAARRDWHLPRNTWCVVNAELLYLGCRAKSSYFLLGVVINAPRSGKDAGTEALSPENSRSGPEVHYFRRSENHRFDRDVMPCLHGTFVYI